MAPTHHHAPHGETLVAREGEADHHHHHDDAHHAHDHGPGDASVRSSSPFSPQEARQARRLSLVIAIVLAFFVLELGGAIMAGSVVLQADALHLLMDVLALGVSLFAMRLAVRRPTPRFTYGLRRAEPVAAIFSAFLVIGTTVFIVVEALDALRGHAQPRPGVMLVVAAMALFVNGLSAWLLHDVIGHPHGHLHDPDNPEDQPHDHGTHAGGHGHALNLRGAWLHLLGDALGAVAALVAALAIRFGGHAAADPIASFIVAAILLFGALRLLRDGALVLLEAAPLHMPVDAVRQMIVGCPGVASVHDLHIWTLGAGHEAITVHVRTDSDDPAFGRELSARIRAAIGAEYVTVQVEPRQDRPDTSDAT
jgi:cobalt-zinc-cadmium efflux system protein